MTLPGGPGTFFVLPPRHRLFVVFDDPEQAASAIRELIESQDVDEDDVWTFYGERGLEAIGGHHGLAVEIVRVFQRAMTNDCEYCDGLRSVLHRGGVVVAIKGKQSLAPFLQERGGHSLAYGAHWNFVPVAGAGESIGSMTDTP